MPYACLEIQLSADPNMNRYCLKDEFCHRHLICAYVLALAVIRNLLFVLLKVNAHSSVISVGHLLLRKVTSSATLNCTQGKNLLSVTSAITHAREEMH